MVFININVISRLSSLVDYLTGLNIFQQKNPFRVEEGICINVLLNLNHQLAAGLSPHPSLLQCSG